MTVQTVELYSGADMMRLRKKIRAWTAVLSGVAAGALAACVTLAATVDTAHAEKMELAAVLISTLAGWFVLYGAIFIVTVSRRELAHAEMLRNGERTRTEGPVSVTKERVVIRKSITARRVEVKCEGGTKRFLVTERRAKALSNASAAAVYTAHGYVAAYEVER